MRFLTLLDVELTKIRRSKIGWILIIPAVLMWVTGIVNADMNFDLQGIPITPEKNFYIQGFMGMVWFMIPATLVIGTVLLIQNERKDRGMLRLLTLPVSQMSVCLAKFVVLILLTAFQMVVTIGVYYLSALIATKMQGYTFILSLDYILPRTVGIYLAAVPMAAVFWMLAVLIQRPVFSVGAGLASIVPSVLIINTKIWFLYPVSYPFYVLMTQYGQAAPGMYAAQIEWLPWMPAAVLITIAALSIAGVYFGNAERK